MGLGDYVYVRRRMPPLVRRGVRGTVVALEGDWATVRRPDGTSFQSRTDNLSRLVTAATL